MEEWIEFEYVVIILGLRSKGKWRLTKHVNGGIILFLPNTEKYFDNNNYYPPL